jgi:hypothetical protein
MEIFNLKDEKVLDQIVSIVESSENQNRILKHTIDYQIINGNQKQHILEDLKKRYPESYNSMVVINLKIADKIIRKLSRSYLMGVKREVINCENSTVNQEMTDLINYIYSDINDNGEDFNDILSKSDKYYTAHEYVELFSYEDQDGYIRLKSLPQHVFTAIPNEDKTKAEIIVFKNSVVEIGDYSNIIDYDILATEYSDIQIIASYTIWSENFNFKFIRMSVKEKNNLRDDKIIYKNVIVKNDNNENGVNPYGVMPFTAIKKPTEGHFYPYGSEIAQMSKECNIILSDLVSIAANQGFGQAILYYSGDAPPKLTKAGYTHVIAIENNDGKSRYEYANPSPDLAGHLNIVMSIIRALLSTNDLTTDKINVELSATNFSSGVDRLIADSESVEFTETKQKKYLNVEQKLFRNIVEIIKYQVETGTLNADYPSVSIPNLNKKLKLKLSFNPIKPMLTEKDKAETIKLLQEMGLIFSYEKHLRFNDGMTIDEARARDEAIKEEREEINKEYLQAEIDKVSLKSGNQEKENNDMMEEDKEEEEEDKENDGKTNIDDQSSRPLEQKQKVLRVKKIPARSRRKADR